MSQAASNPWHREALRVLPLAADLHTIDSEAALRVVLLGAGKADDIAERAVARAKAWATLAPLERALIDMLTGAPVTLPDMLAELRHALPDSWQAQLPDEHARTEIELTLVSLRARGLVQTTGLDGETAELLTAWGGFSEEERRESYGGAAALGRLSQTIARLGSSNPDLDLVQMPTRIPPERMPTCARCNTPVPRMLRFDDIVTGDTCFELTCHGETRKVLFTRAELVAAGKISVLIADRLAAAWGPST